MLIQTSSGVKKSSQVLLELCSVISYREFFSFANSFYSRKENAYNSELNNLKKFLMRE